MLHLAASQLAPPGLPGPGFLQFLILEKPEVFLVLQVIAALVILWQINQRGALKRLWFLPLICVAIGAGVYAYGHSVETTRERLMRHTVEFVDAMVAQDEPRVAAMVDESIVIEDVRGVRDYDGLIREMNGPYIPLIESYSVNVRGGVKDNDNAGRTQASVNASLSGTGRAGAPGIFLFSWRRAADGSWKLVTLTMQRPPL
ncbi:MAG: hypothetical protein RLN60_01500 [Phycisphaerales bacterium]